MRKVQIEKLRSFVQAIHVASGMNQEHADIVADVFVRASLRDVAHHDIYDLPGRLEAYKSGDMNANANFQQLSKYEAMERYDGDNGSGELACAFIMDRATSMAEQYGMGFCTIRNSNHYLAAGPYNEMAAEKGFVNILYTRTPPSLSNPEGTAKVVGTCPMGFAAETNREYPVLLDVCLAYLANSAINEKVANNQSVPSHYGKDKHSNPTTDPAAIKEGFRLPIGGHKGFGLAILCEILTGVFSGGQIIDEANPVKKGTYGIFSHTAIAFKADGLMSMEEFKNRTTEMLDRMENRDPNLHIPGSGLYKSKRKIEVENGIHLDEKLVEKLNQRAQELGVHALID
jgi:LDH2 family malate/lactate/ureidoglycolate dehydrogenase